MSIRRATIAVAAIAILMTGALSAEAQITWTVTNLNDSGTGSLRDAMTSAAADTGDTVVFASGLNGTITLESSLPTITTSMTITGPGANAVAISGAGITGAFIYIAGGSATITGLTFENLAAANTDGGINFDGVAGSVLTLSQDAFLNNSTSSYGTGGAAVQAFAGAVNVSQCTFVNNSALAGGVGVSSGGAIFAGRYDYGSLGPLTVTNSTFYQNSAPAGGAIYASASTIVNSTFVNNSATIQAGGAIDIFGGIATVSNNIIAGNSQPGGYSSLALYSTAITQALYSKNNVFFENYSTDTTFEDDCMYCTESGDVEASSNPAGSLALNGGALQTMMPMPGSGAICEGLVSQLPGGTTTDQRGYARLNTTYPGFNSGTACLDAGAVQSKYAFSITTEPPASLLTGAAMSPAPQVKVTENGSLLSTTPVPVNMTDTSDALATTPATANTSAGVATFSSLIFDIAASGDELTATLPLNPGLSTPLNLTAASSTFAVNWAPVAVPSVVGLTQAAATTSITTAGLVLGTVTPTPSTTVAIGIVISESPTAGTSVSHGSAVNLAVSTGVAVPNVVGLSQAAATTAITGASFIVGTVTTARSTTVAVGNVISESPAAGTRASHGSAVNLVVSSGVAVPNVVGLTQAAATTAITDAGLTLGTVTQTTSTTVPIGDVISENPAAGASANAGSPVNLVVSSGVAVPNVVGSTQAAATTSITGAGLVVGTVTSAPSATVAVGNVISESPSAGTSVNGGSHVNLVISTGVTVPNVVGLTQAAATTAITGAGLTLGTVTMAASSTVPSGDVISQTPAAAQQVNGGTAVNIVVSTGPSVFYVLNIASSNSAWGSVTPATGSSNLAGAKVAITATPTAGHYFAGWTGSSDIASPSSASTTITMNGTETIVANFGIPSFVVTTNADDATGIAAHCPGNNSPPSANCTLRDALAAAAVASGGGFAATITFSPAAFNSTNTAAQNTITLGSGGTLNIPPATTIAGLTTGSGATLANLVTVSGANTYLIFNVASGTVAIGNLTIANGSGANGGGIANAGKLTVTNSTFQSNTAVDYGGAIDNTTAGSTLIVGNSTFTGNSAFNGGAIENVGDLTAYNSTFTMNSAVASGAIDDPGTTILANDTITGNTATASGYGGGIGVSGTLDMLNVILSGNTNGDDLHGSFVNVGGNLVGASSVNLTPLGNYGGPTQTMLLLPNSTAICNGASEDLIPLGITTTTDQRGFGLTSGYCPGGALDSGAVQTHYALSFSTQPPASVNVGQTFTPAPVVQVNESGMVVTAAAGTVNISNVSSDGPPPLNGTTSVSLSAGKATFSNIQPSAAQTSASSLSASFTITHLAAYGGAPLNVRATSNSFNVTVSVTPATLTAPTPGTVLTGPAVTFTWSAVTGATAYQVWIGSTGVNTNNVYSSGIITATSVMPLSLPLNGEKLYVRLFTEIGGTWYHNDYTYTAATPAAISAPATGSTLPGPLTTFTWTAPAGAGAYQLWLGSTGVNSNNLFSSGLTHSNTTTRTNMPTNGETIYARLFTDFNGTWVSVNYTFTAALQSAPVSPAIGATLAGPTQTFTWSTATGSAAAAYQFWIGSTGVGSNNVYSSGILHTTTVTRANLPTNGETLYARIYTDYSGTWVHQDYTLTAAAQSTIISPAPGSTLSGANVTFNWSTATGSNATQYQLWLGTTGAGSNNLYSSGAITAKSVTRTSLPTTGGTIYARLYTNYNGTWVHADFTYVEAP